MKILLYVFLLSLPMCKGKKEKEQPYDMPPSAPVPPEKTCYEFKQSDKSNDIMDLELTVEGDSVYGNFEHKIDQAKVEEGKLTGIIYGSTLFVKYHYTAGGITKNEDQEWKLTETSIFKTGKEVITDDSSGTITQPDSEKSHVLTLLKIPCK